MRAIAALLLVICETVSAIDLATSCTDMPWNDWGSWPTQQGWNKWKQRRYEEQNQWFWPKKKQRYDAQWTSEQWTDCGFESKGKSKGSYGYGKPHPPSVAPAMYVPEAEDNQPPQPPEEFTEWMPHEDDPIMDLVQERHRGFVKTLKVSQTGFQGLITMSEDPTMVLHYHSANILDRCREEIWSHIYDQNFIGQEISFFIDMHRKLNDHKFPTAVAIRIHASHV